MLPAFASIPCTAARRGHTGTHTEGTTMQAVDYASAVQAMNAQVVFSNALGEQFTRAQALDLFNAVCHMEDWKLPVDCELPRGDLRRLGGVEAMRKAVEFFTGSTCTVDDMGKSYRVRARGYYMACGA